MPFPSAASRVGRGVLFAFAAFAGASASAAGPGPGPIAVQVRLREIETLGAANDAAFFGVVGPPDDFTYHVSARDLPDLDGADFASNPACDTLSADPPVATSDFNRVIFDHVYVGATPDAIEISLDAWEDEAPDQLLGVACGGTRCAFDTGFCCGGFLFGVCLGALDDDDRRCQAAPFAAVDYQLGAPCEDFDHSKVASTVGGNCDGYQPHLQSTWRYVHGDTAAAPIALGALAEGGAITHKNSTSTTCYTSDDATLPTPDVYYTLDVASRERVSVSVCSPGGEPAISVYDAGGTVLAASPTGCSAPAIVPICRGQLLMRIDSATDAGAPFTLTITDLLSGSDAPGLCCGDGTLDRGEACDTAGASAGCDVDCSVSACGDGTTNEPAGETCDDGALNGEPNHCNGACTGITPASCGNDATEAGEDCDTAGASATCDGDCTPVTCGDSTVNTAAGEACDDGGANGSPNHCDSTCTGTTPSVCGNGVMEAGEACDTNGASQTCDADCTFVSCGDGTINGAAAETCDDGALNAAPNHCDSACAGTTPATCGNSVTEAGEGCDGGAVSATCDGDCSAATCGDGTENVLAGETCDEGALNGTPNHCDGTCTGVTPSVCGNGVAEAGEACDTTIATAACDADCTSVTCGDGVANAAASETCDDGAKNATPNHCDGACAGPTAATCGNAIVEAGEACDAGSATAGCDGDCTEVSCGDSTTSDAAGETCDDGALNGTPNQCADTCTGTTASVCGNSVAEAGETCDTGAASTTCDSDCSAAECGDGAVNAEASESCDDGVLNGTPSHCNSACSGETPATCGNGETEAGEACDTSGATATCDADCTEVTCGDSTKNAAANEACDEGPLNGSPNHCDATCAGTTAPSCGNSAVEAGEDCDTAAASSSCDADCSTVICGDGVQNAEAGESCDDGAQNGQPGACTSACDGQVPEPCPGGTGCDTCAATGVCGDDLGSDDLGSDDLGSDAGPTHDAGADLGPDPLGEVSGSSFFCGAARGTVSGTPVGIGLALSLALLWRRRRSASPSSPRNA